MVVDLTRFLSGPFTTLILGDLGAEIIKIEKPRTGDETRTDYPTKNGSSAMYASINRGKRSIDLDLRDPNQKGILLELIKKADILVENFKPGTMQKMGLDYETVHAENERLIYCSISGFGQTGPYRNRGAMDISIQAMSGFMSVTGPKGGEPTKAGPSIADTVAGFYAVISILAAVMQRQKSGQGQFIDVGMLDCMVASVMMVPYARYCLSGVLPFPEGNRHPASAPFQVFNTKDGSIVVCCSTNAQFQKLMEGLDHNEIYEDPRFKDTAQRYPNKDELERVLIPIFAEKTTKEIADMMAERGLAFGEINNMELLRTNEQLISRGIYMPVTVDHVGELVSCAFPAKMSGLTFPTKGHAPQVGEDTHMVLEKYLGGKADEKPSRSTS